MHSHEAAWPLSFQLPSTVILRHGAATELGSICAGAGYTSAAVVVVDPHAAPARAFDDALATLKAAGVI